MKQSKQALDKLPRRKEGLFLAIPHKIDTGLPCTRCSSGFQQLQTFRYKSDAMQKELNRFPRYLRAILCKNQTKWEMKNFDPPT